MAIPLLTCHECHIKTVRVDGIPTCPICGSEVHDEGKMFEMVLGIRYSWHFYITNAPKLPLSDKHKEHLHRLFMGYSGNPSNDYQVKSINNNGAIGGLDR